MIDDMEALDDLSDSSDDGNVLSLLYFTKCIVILIL